MSPAPAYTFSNSSPQAETQLDLLQHMLDPHTIGHVSSLNLAPDARCWEIGAGAGSIARWLATEPQRQVIATDIDTTHLDTGGRVQAITHDITSAELPEPGPYDLIHARLVLLHLPQRLDILGRLVDSLAPGGWLMLEEFDCEEPLRVLTAASKHDAALFTHVHHAIITALTSRGASPTWAYQTYEAMRAAGLDDITSVVRAEAATASSVAALLHEVNTRQLHPTLLKLGVTAAQLDAFRGLMHDPTFTAMGYPLVSSWGRRPR